MLKQRIITSLWWLLAVAVAGLQVAAVQQKKQSLCSEIKVEIEDNEGHPFVDEKDIVTLLQNNGAVVGKRRSEIGLRTLENTVKTNAWIQNAELYFDNNNVLQVKIKEREPIARIITVNGSSFYIDSAGKRLPLSSDYTAHVSVFTSFSSDKRHLTKRDSLLLCDIKNIASFIQQDSFLNALVSQVVITPQNTFTIIPVVGNQTIIFGNADSLQSKFSRLTAFYKQVWAKNGFEKYETINVSFANQVVATRRGAPKPYVDSVLAQRIVTAMRSGIDILKDSSFFFHEAEMAQKAQPDTTLEQITTIPSDSAATFHNNMNGTKFVFAAKSKSAIKYRSKKR